MAFARHQFELVAPQESDGLPLRAHLEAHERQTGNPHPMLIGGPMLPHGCEQLWSDFLEMHDCRGSNGFGPSRITYADIYAFQQVTGATLKPWEIEIVRKADSLWLSEFVPQPKADEHA